MAWANILAHRPSPRNHPTPCWKATRLGSLHWKLSNKLPPQQGLLRPCPRTKRPTQVWKPRGRCNPRAPPGGFTQLLTTTPWHLTADSVVSRRVASSDWGDVGGHYRSSMHHVLLPPTSPLCVLRSNGFGYPNTCMSLPSYEHGVCTLLQWGRHQGC